MEFSTSKDKQTYDSIVEYLGVLAKIEQLEQQYKIMSDGIDSFYFYGENHKKFDKPISSRTLGKTSVEYANTEAYTIITPETISFDKASVLERPKEHQKLVEDNHLTYRFTDMYSKYEKLNFKSMPIISIVLGVLLSIALYVLFALSITEKITNNTVISEILSFTKTTWFWKLFAGTMELGDPDFDSSLVLSCPFFVAFYGLIFAIISFVIVLIISVPIKMIEASKMNKKSKGSLKEKNDEIQNYNAQVDSYNSHLDEYNEEIVENAINKEIAFLQKWAQLFRNNMNKVSDLTDLCGETREEIKKLETKRDAFINSGIIHKDYATNPVALYRMVDYFERGRCTCFEGNGGAIDKYHTELFNNVILSRFDKLDQGLMTISNQLSEIKDNQYALARAVTSVKQSVDMTRKVISEKLDDVNYHLGDIKQLISTIPTTYYDDYRDDA